MLGHFGKQRHCYCTYLPVLINGALAFISCDGLLLWPNSIFQLFMPSCDGIDEHTDA